jgi:putative ABC transport system substrate-binding protein
VRGYSNQKKIKAGIIIQELNHRAVALYLLSNFVLLLALCLVFIWPAHADHKAEKEPHIAILYPTVSKQYTAMFDDFIAGIKSVPGYEFIIHRADKDTTSDSINQWSKEQDVQGYIALGQTTYKLVDSLDSELPLIAGGMVATPPGISGISLSGEPEAFLSQLQLLNPEINRVYFVYSKKNNSWLADRARAVSKKYNIEFVPLQVDSLKQATLQYNIVLQSVQPRTDAIWIPLDNIAPLDLMMPEILQVAWDKHITVFSNNMLHASRGVLFSLYPDNNKQGRRLVSLLQRHLDNNNIIPQLYPSVDFKIAVNMRTAAHLDMHYSKDMIKTFDQVFPAYK